MSVSSKLLHKILNREITPQTCTLQIPANSLDVGIGNFLLRVFTNPFELLTPSVFQGLVKDIEPGSEHKPEAIDIKETKEGMPQMLNIIYYIKPISEDEGKIRPMTTIRRISSVRTAL